MRQELNSDQRLFRGFITSSARLFTALSDRHDDLEQSVTNANTAFGTIARENAELDRTLRLLAPTFRQSNTTFVNLRAALDDLEPLVDTAKPATRGPRPVSWPGCGRWSRRRCPWSPTCARRSPARAGERPRRLFTTLPTVQGRAGSAFGRAERAIDDFQPTLDFARPYTPDILNALTKLGQITGYYDANGHYARAGVANLNLFSYQGRPVGWTRSRPTTSTGRWCRRGSSRAPAAPPLRPPTTRTRSSARSGPRAASRGRLRPRRPSGGS